MVYQGVPVIRRDTVSWWTTAGDNAHSQTDTHSPKFSIFSDWQGFKGRLWVILSKTLFVCVTD